MQLCLDVVDLLQLGELWCKRPIVTAFTRLESRPTLLSNPFEFNIEDLLPRLARLKYSAAWRIKNTNLTIDPARIPLSGLSDEYLNEMYPEASSAAAQRQAVFNAAYNRFVVSCYRGEVNQTIAMFQSVAQARAIAPETCLDKELLPRPGAPEWIPSYITDEMRSLDTRYNPVEPGTPATYVISDDFWALLVKATAEDLDSAAQLQHKTEPDAANNGLRTAFENLASVAYMWYRSPSVVGLCYQVADASQ